mmetsp:Transcript_148363/g.413303  ORF Transcript_148363/g.413303 Transcript_148363/m.413303 type:complete len:267 (+) Transcript_148363:376-1176(+)
MTLIGTPARLTEIAASKASLVASTSLMPVPSVSPQTQVLAVSAWNPSWKSVTSTFTRSPFSNGLSSGMPWQITSFTLIIILFGKPLYPRSLGYAPAPHMKWCSSNSIASVVRPGTMRLPAKSRAECARWPAVRMAAMASGDLLSMREFHQPRTFSGSATYGGLGMCGGTGKAAETRPLCNGRRNGATAADTAVAAAAADTRAPVGEAGPLRPRCRHSMPWAIPRPAAVPGRPPARRHRSPSGAGARVGAGRSFSGTPCHVLAIGTR